jgi:hypothetical protein
MGVFIDGEALKPLQCSACGGQRIANMLNEGVIRCLDCGREQPDPSSVREMLRREMGSGQTYAPVNDKPYREF